MYALVQSPAFKYTIFTIIILSCIELAAEGPRVVAGSTEDSVLYYRCEEGPCAVLLLIVATLKS